MSREATVGICAFATSSDGFLAVTKQRYSDFIVREVDMKGQVVPLTALPSAFTSANETEPIDVNKAEAQITALLGKDQADAIRDLERVAALWT